MNRKFLLIFFFLISVFSLSQAQYFGQNKIQHRQFTWKVTHTEHYDIYYYQGMEEIAYFASVVAESAYVTLSHDLGHDFSQPIPILLYKCPNDFSETNITLELLSEAVGGFTEMLKGRVVCPFNGSYEDLRHVVHHELTHAFQFDILYGSSNILSKGYLIDVPLWWMEGMSEFESRGWDMDADMYIRDLILSDKLIPLTVLSSYGGYIVYKEGQSVMHFISERYGRKKIGEIFHNIKITGSLNQALLRSIDINIVSFNEEWVKFLNSRYWPEYNEFEDIEDYSLRLTDARREHNYLNISPSISPNGLNVAFITDAEIYSDIYIMSALTGEIQKKVLGGQRSPQFESFHLLKSSISWSPDGTRIILSSLSNGEDLLWIVETSTGKVLKKLDFDLDIVLSPYWAVNGNIYFIGTLNGKTDIYETDTEGSYLVKITNDIFDDRDPYVSKDGKKLIWVSDRNLEGDSLWGYGSYAVFFMDLETGEMRRLTPRSQYCSNPQFTGEYDDNILFIASYSTGKNIYRLDLATNKIFQLTNVTGEIVSFSIDRDSRRMVLNAYDMGRWDIFSIEDPLISLEQTEIENFQNNFDIIHTDIKQPDDSLYWNKPGLQLSADWGQASVAYSNLYGMAGLLTMSFSDIMGNHRIILQTDLNQDILKSNFNLLYFNLAKRIDVGFGIYQEKYAYWHTEDTIVGSKYLGAGILLLYPFNRFQRCDFNLDFYEQQKEYHYYDEYNNKINFVRDTSELFISPSIYYVYDNSVWGWTSPFIGTRLRFGGGLSHRLYKNTQYYYGNIDIRKYWRITPRSNFAARVYYAGTRGTDAPEIHIGGYNSIRGYDWNELEGLNIGMINLEVRFPFIDNLEVIFPLPLYLQGLRGCLFTDIGAATSHPNQWQPFSEREGEGWGLEDLKMDIGFGLRMFFWTAVLKFDIALPTDLRNLSNRSRMWFSIGEDF